MALKAARVRRIVSLGLSGFFMNPDQQPGPGGVQRHPPGLWRRPVCGRDDHYQLLREVFMMPVHGLSSGAQPVTGYNYAGRGCTAGCGSPFASAWRGRWAVPPCSGRRPWCSQGADPDLQRGRGGAGRWGPGHAGSTSACSSPCRSRWRGRGCSSAGRSRQAIFFSLLRKAVINAPDGAASGLDGDGRGVRGGGGVPAGGGLACIITMYWTVYRPFGRLPDRAEGCKEDREDS